jgi:hypothetical protein
VDLIKEADEVLETSPKAINAPGCNEVELPPGGSLQHLVEGRSLVAPICSADAMVDVFLRYFPAVALGDRSQFLKLILGGLMIC